ncbi:rhamnulokinase [Actinoalloteichus sp. AHMU CJ021]|uniref:rhamnulokinase n=1 Tax=Actinoalloteichus TaxID=65496 RepID=UPI000CA00011|nr:rhamnulokinase [Actinoalloteichus sp. AHMU CJ021]
MHCAAVDLGASSGRVLLGRIGGGELSVTEAARFPNDPVRTVDGSGVSRLHWDVLGLYQRTLGGLAAAAQLGGTPLSSVGIDSWAVDYGLLDAEGALLGTPFHYRDARTEDILPELLDDVPAERIYDITGIQFMPINTLVQLRSRTGRAQLDHARTLLLIPDLLGYWLTGERVAEVTNASTTQLFDVRARRWSPELADAARIPPGLLPPVREPGLPLGAVHDEVASHHGLPAGLPVVTVGSHDTASAVVAVPATTERFGYVSCGTWSLVGLELDHPVLTDDSRRANFTNELGVDGTVRYLRNVMGLWLLQESMRAWRIAGQDHDIERLLADASREQPFRSVLDPDDPVFLAPGDMPARIADACRRAGQPVPETPAALTRCVLESLALAYARTLRTACELADRQVDVLHLVGGGCRNELLCQLTADACGIPVVAGPVEATALGNLLVQARAAGRSELAGLPEMRALITSTQPLRRYEPDRSAATTSAWAEAARRVRATSSAS